MYVAFSLTHQVHIIQATHYHIHKMIHNYQMYITHIVMVFVCLLLNQQITHFVFSVLIHCRFSYFRYHPCYGHLWP